MLLNSLDCTYLIMLRSKLAFILCSASGTYPSSSRARRRRLAAASPLGLYLERFPPQ